jgi:ribosomal subunit interface protein
MHIIITSVHMDMTESIRSYALDKMRTLEKYIPSGDTSGKLTVELSRTTTHHAHGDVFQAEGILHIRGKETTVRTTQDDLYKAIDILKDMLSRELAQHKDKERSIFRRSAHKVKALFKRLTD